MRGFYALTLAIFGRSSPLVFWIWFLFILDLFSIYSGLNLCSRYDIFLCGGIVSFVSSIELGVLVWDNFILVSYI